MIQEGKPSKRNWLPILIIVLVFVLFVVFVDFGDVIDVLRDVDLGVLLLSATVLMGGFLLISLRWRYLLGKRIKFLKTFHLDSICYKIRMFTPIFVPVLRMVTITMAIPITISQAMPAMIGIYQGIMVALLLPYGVANASQSTAHALLAFGVQIVL